MSVSLGDLKRNIALLKSVLCFLESIVDCLEDSKRTRAGELRIRDWSAIARLNILYEINKKN